MSWFSPKWARKSGAKDAAAQTAALPPGRVCYAIGDIHGRLDLARRLLGLIAEDAARAPYKMILFIFLGDYVDRGAESRGVIDLLTALKRDGGASVITLKGNHEEALLGFLADAAAGPAWVEHGGMETLKSYGVDTPRKLTDEQGWESTREAFAAALPPEHLAFLHALERVSTLGDYVFVHAGVRPGVPIERQDAHDLLWIRKGFVDAPRALEGKIVVHGHTPHPEPLLGDGRIGVDTGAYATGVLTAVRLEEDRRSFIQTGGR